MKRVFIAIRVNPEEALRNLLRSIRESLPDENIKWTDPAGIHVTLAFLGDTPEEKIKEVVQILREVSSSFRRFEFILKGTGIFKNLSNPRIIWVGTIESRELVRLNEVVNEGVGRLGFQVEERAFRPHVTIGRVKAIRNHDNLRQVIEKYRNTEIQKVPVSEVILYESILGGPSAIYRPVYSAGLS